MTASPGAQPELDFAAKAVPGALVYFDGETYDPVFDEVRLERLLYRVWALMADQRFRTLGEISIATGGSEASVSARLRDFRKRHFGAHLVTRLRLEGGLYAYSVTPNGAEVGR